MFVVVVVGCGWVGGWVSVCVVGVGPAYRRQSYRPISRSAGGLVRLHCHPFPLSVVSCRVNERKHACMQADRPGQPVIWSTLCVSHSSPLARPRIYGTPQHCIHSDGFFELDKLPKRVAVVGAGYIAGTTALLGQAGTHAAGIHP